MPPSLPQHPFITKRATQPPGKCAVTGDIDGPFLDCGKSYENRGYWQRLYLHLPWLEEQAVKHLGLVSRDEISSLEDRAEAAEEELEALRTAFDALTDARKVAA